MSGYYPPSGPPPGQQFQQPPGAQYWGGPPPPQQQFGGYPGQYQQGGQFMPPQGPPQGQQYQHPPFGQPPQFQHPPQQGLQQHPQHFQPPPQQFQQPPPQQYQQSSAPSPGYDNFVPQGNADPDVDQLMKAMSGFRRDHATIIRILAKADPARMALLRQSYARRNNGASLESKVESSFKSHYGDALVQLVRGPCVSDAHNVNRAVKGLGTKEDMLNDVLIGRSNADLRAIKNEYQRIFKRSMESDVEGDLSLKTKTMFQQIMRASRTEESYPYNPVEISRDVGDLRNAMHGPSISTDQEKVYTILTQRSNNQIRAIDKEFGNGHRKLEDTIKSNFSGHMQDALVLALLRACDPAKADATGLEHTMKGLGTKDDLLVNETIRIHWNRQHVDQVKKAYQHYFNRDLIARVRGETSGDYRDALVACLT